MTTKDYVAIVDAIVDTRDVKPLTKLRICQGLIPALRANTSDFNQVLYWRYVEARFGAVLGFSVADGKTLPSTKP